MEPSSCRVLLWILLIWPSNTTDLHEMDADSANVDKWMYRDAKGPAESDEACLRVHPNSRDIIRRFHAILPYFDKNHSNTAFLHKFRATVYAMSEGEDLLDREAALYAAALTPLIFLQNYRDTWCLIERFHRSLRLFQMSHPTEKRSALRLLQNFRSVSQKVLNFVRELPGTGSADRAKATATSPDFDEEELHDKRDVRFFKELIKNLG